MGTVNVSRALAGVLAAAVLMSGCGGGIEAELEEHQLAVTDLRIGDGVAAEPGDHVTARIGTWIHAEGAKGRELAHFGSDPVVLTLAEGELMPGLLEGMLGMREGGVRQIVIGPEKITPRFRPHRLLTSEDLWCEVELLAVARVEVEELVVGDGDAVADGDYVEVDYTGWHADSTGAKADQFITSAETGKPARLLLGADMVNEGLDTGLRGMRVGGERRIVVPPELAYGDDGRDSVRPGATLIYEVELLRTLGVTTETLREGTGNPLAPGQRVHFHLAGWLRNPDGGKGEQFQDSRDLSNAYTAIVGSFKVQPGIELGLRGMRRGGLRRVHVPSDLAFGSRGWHRGPRTLVPPDTDVIYEIEVLDGARR